MNLDQLAQLRAAARRTQTVTAPASLGNCTLRLRDLGALDLADLRQIHAAAETPADRIRLLIELLARAVVDDAGTAYLNNGPGRNLLASLPPQDLNDLANHAMTVAGLDEAAEDDRKKKLNPQPG